jgi:D-alanyl-lipoteichoic acid acyltransferase DltB (MBOAT superfamily)
VEAFLNSPFWGWLIFASVVLGLIAAALFVIRYQLEVGSRWWKNEDGTPNSFGRFLMIRKALLAGLFSLVLANWLLPDWPGRRMVTAILMFGFALQTFVPYRLLISAQRAQEKEEARNGAVRNERDHG